jgi:hypothetical protein
MSKLLSYFRILLPSQLDGRFMGFPLALLGVVCDWITTQIGLGMGFYETHLAYNPVTSLAIFWGAIVVLYLALPRGKKWDAAILVMASCSFLGAVNNTLVILGVFGGWVI